MRVYNDCNAQTLDEAEYLLNSVARLQRENPGVQKPEVYRLASSYIAHRRIEFNSGSSEVITELGEDE